MTEGAMTEGAMTEGAMTEHTFEVHFESGHTADFELIPLGGDRYRMSSLASIVLSFACEEEDGFPEDARVGWILRGDPIGHLELRFRQAHPDPEVTTVSAFFPPGPGLEDFPPFRRYVRRIMEAGGNWELVLGGMFSAWAPRRRAGGTEPELDLELRAVLALYQDAYPEPPGPGDEDPPGGVLTDGVLPDEKP
jgi:hypothetical protein